MKLRNRMLAIFAGIMPAAAFAQTDFTDLVAAVDFADAAEAVLGVAAALITLYVILKGVRVAIGYVKSG